MVKGTRNPSLPLVKVWSLALGFLMHFYSTIFPTRRPPQRLLGHPNAKSSSGKGHKGLLGLQTGRFDWIKTLCVLNTCQNPRFLLVLTKIKTIFSAIANSPQRHLPPLQLQHWPMHPGLINQWALVLRDCHWVCLEKQGFATKTTFALQHCYWYLRFKLKQLLRPSLHNYFITSFTSSFITFCSQYYLTTADTYLDTATCWTALQCP